MNHALLSLGLLEAPVAWVVNYRTALGAVILVSAWKSYPFFTVMLLAGLQSIASEYYEAARIDGANGWRRFRDVTLPVLKGVIVVAGVLSLLASFREVETIFVLTGGGPARATETLAMRIYNETFQFFEVGEGAALGVMAFLISLAVIALAFPFVARGQGR